MLMDYYILWRHATVFDGEATEEETRKDAANVALVLAERLLAESSPSPRVISLHVCQPGYLAIFISPHFSLSAYQISNSYR